MEQTLCSGTVFLREGTDMAILADSSVVDAAMEAADMLGSEGVSVGVVGLISVETDLLRHLIQRCPMVLIVESALNRGLAVTALRLMAGQLSVEASSRVRVRAVYVHDMAPGAHQVYKEARGLLRDQCKDCSTCTRMLC